MNRLFIPSLVFLVLTQFSSAAQPAGLKKASIEEISGDVIVKKSTDTADRQAILKESITGKDIIRTGKKSRAELEFEDQSICRLGSNTIFSFDPQTRDMAFSRGVALVHVPPGKGGARIATPAATAAIQGDTLVVRATVMPDGTPATQFTALSPKGGPTDGNIIVTLNNNPNASFRLEGGQVAIVPANANSLSQVPRAEIDVGTFAAKSPMLQDLPPTAKQEVNIVTVNQTALFNSGVAERTEYAIVGDQVVKADANGNFTPPPPAPTTTTSTAPAPTGTVAPDGTVTMPDGTKVSPDGTVTRTDGTTTTATTLSDGTQVMPNGTKVAPDGRIITTSGTTTYSGTGGAYTAPDGTTLTSGGTYSPYSAPTTAFFNPDQPLTTTFSPFQQTLAQVTSGPPPPTGALPPGAHFPFQIATFAIGNGYIINSTLGTIFDGGSVTYQKSATTFDFVINSSGVGEFAFDRLSLSGSIQIEGGRNLRLLAENNSLGTPVSIGTTTFSFTQGGNSIAIESVNHPGNIVQSGGTTLTLASGDISLIAHTGDIDVKNISTSGASFSSGSTAGGNGGNVKLQANSGTVTLNGTITASGGSVTTSGTGAGGAAGTVNIQASTVTFAANDIIANGGGSVSAAGRNGGVIDVKSTSSGLMDVVANVNLSANGGVGSTSNGSGGTVTLTANSISIPTSTSSPITATGAGSGTSGGTVTLNSSSTIDLAQSSNQTIINVSQGTGPTGGSITFNSTSPVTITDNALTAPVTLNAGTGGTISSSAGIAAGSTYTTNP